MIMMWALKELLINSNVLLRGDIYKACRKLLSGAQILHHCISSNQQGIY